MGQVLDMCCKSRSSQQQSKLDDKLKPEELSKFDNDLNNFSDENVEEEAADGDDGWETEENGESDDNP